MDSVGQTTRYRYDSRDNLVAQADAQGPAAPPVIRRSFRVDSLAIDNTNLPGNVTRYSYDGISRNTGVETVLTATGQGDGVNIGADIFGVRTATPTPDPSQGGGDGLITSVYQWDGNSLLTSLTDDNGNRTGYTYDNLDRLVAETKGTCVAPALADSCDTPTTTTYEYDQDHNLVRTTDENGSVIDSQYDAVDRVIATTVTTGGAGVVGTTATSYEYDGLSRLTRATDNNDPADSGDDSTVTYAYDSLGRVIEETQQIGGQAPSAVSSAWRAENLRSSLTYPNGRVLVYTYDGLDRLKSVADQFDEVAVAEYDYIGPSRVAQRVHPMNGTRLTYLDDTGTTDVGYDGLRRPVQLRHLRGDDSLIAGFGHTYDRLDNALGENKLHDAANDEHYQYDSAYRLTQFQRPDVGAIAPLQSQWTLDGVGNWSQVDGETRQHSSFNEVIQRSEGGVTSVLSDDNGNVTDDGTHTFEWDYRNRLRTVTRKSDGQVVTTYSYDANGRRIRKVVANSGVLDGTTDFYYDGWQVLEERDGAGLPVQQYIYGNGIDEPLLLDRDLNGDGNVAGAGDQRLFYHQNTQDSVFALTDDAGAIVEGYQYDAYGRQTVFQPGTNGVVDFGNDDIITPGGNSALGNPYMFTGRRLDHETENYYSRNRYYDPLLGRFLSRDPLGYDALGSLNLYEYPGGNPITYTDPMGLNGEEPGKVKKALCWLGDQACSVLNISFRFSDATELAEVFDETAKDLGDKKKLVDQKKAYDKAMGITPKPKPKKPKTLFDRFYGGLKYLCGL